MDKPVAGYYRVSVYRDGGIGPELYEADINRYCTYKNLELAEIFSDLDMSGFRGSKPRPALEALKERRAEFSAVIIPKLARFGRSVKDLINLFELFDRDGISLVFLDMNLDTSTSQGRLLRNVMAAFAEYESDVKADYTRANHQRVRAEGLAWGVPPFGFVRGPEPHSWVIDEPKAALIRRIYDDYAGGASANAIAHALNEADIPTARGVRWKGQAIGTMLDNPAYAALSLSDDRLVPARWPAIVARETWDVVRARRDADPRRRGNLGKPRPHAPYLLSGLMWCGLCGRKMTHTTRTRDGRGSYHCAGDTWTRWSACLDMRVNGDLAEAFVTERFLERCAFTILTDSGARSGSPRTLWEEASLDERKRLLALTIDRVVVTPKGLNIPRSEYRKVLRHALEVRWNRGMADAEDVVVLADPPDLTPRPLHGSRSRRMRAAEYRGLVDGPAPDATGMSWGEWRRARILPPSEESAQQRSFPDPSSVGLPR